MLIMGGSSKRVEVKYQKTSILKRNKLVGICLEFLAKTNSSLFGNFHELVHLLQRKKRKEIGKILQNNKWEEVSD